MNIQEIRELIRVKPPELRAADRRLAHCHDIADLRRAAQRLIPRPVFDYVDGGSDEELSLAGNVEAFRRWRLVPRALANVAEVDTAGQVLGHPVPLPLVLAPTGYTRIMHPGGEIAAARSASGTACPTRCPPWRTRRSKTWPPPRTAICGSSCTSRPTAG